MNKKLFLGLVLTSFMVSTQASAGLFDHLESVGDKPFQAPQRPSHPPQGASALAHSDAIEKFVGALEAKAVASVEWGKKLAEDGLKAVEMLKNPTSFQLSDLVDLLGDKHLSISKGTLEGALFKKDLTTNDFLVTFKKENTENNIEKSTLMSHLSDILGHLIPKYDSDKLLNDTDSLKEIRKVGILFLQKFLAGLWKSEHLSSDEIQKILAQNRQFFPELKTIREERRRAIQSRKTLFLDSSSSITKKELYDLTAAFEKDPSLNPEKFTDKKALEKALEKIKQSIGVDRFQAIMIAAKGLPRTFFELLENHSYLPVLDAPVVDQSEDEDNRSASFSSHVSRRSSTSSDLG